MSTREPSPEPRTFDDFWPLYVREHRTKTARLVHFAGTTAALGCVAGAILTRRPWLLAVAPVVSYGPAWLSHLVVEGNTPTTFRYPLWSLRADLVMWCKTLSRELDAEVERVLSVERDDPREAEGPAAGGAEPAAATAAAN